jgi:hypothetical protein
MGRTSSSRRLGCALTAQGRGRLMRMETERTTAWTEGAQVEAHHWAWLLGSDFKAHGAPSEGEALGTQPAAAQKSLVSSAEPHCADSSGGAPWASALTWGPQSTCPGASAPLWWPFRG